MGRVEGAVVHLVTVVLVAEDPRPAAEDRVKVVCLPEIEHGTTERTLEPDPVQPGERLAYTISVINTGDVDLSATITDTLPLSVTLDEASGGTLVMPEGTVGITWTALITAPGAVWMETVVVTVEKGYEGPLVNLVEVTTGEGATGRAVIIVNAHRTYLPLVLR